jgi:uncharacterized repeat protein (TIGR04138 family)
MARNCIRQRSEVKYATPSSAHACPNRTLSRLRFTNIQRTTFSCSFAVWVYDLPESMICEQCNQREATVHFTQIFGRTTQRTDLCVDCARGMPHLANALLSERPSRREILNAALGDNRHYPIEAYEFVCESLDFCQKLQAEKDENQTIHHVSGKELLEAFRQLAIRKFGKQAKAVLGSWKIHRTDDFGEIVFQMIDAGTLRKQPEDTKEEFQNGFNFEEAFPET